jgi:divalent metal cation (Fe/Co/Zn/Cd) transporter
VHTISSGADVVVHTVPVSENEGVLERIQTVAAREHLAVHNVTTHWTERGTWIDLDLEVDPKVSFERAHALATGLAGHLRAELHGGKLVSSIADISVHIEPQHEALVMGSDIKPAESARFVTRIEAIAQELRYAGGCRDVELHKMNDKVYLSLQLLIDASRPISDVHDIAEEMEARLRREFPQLGRVVIHTEPYQ